MRLDGSLEDFTLPDILQLLATTQKTGSLQLQAADEERRGLVRLASGSVNGASSDLRRHALARRLVGAGLVSDEALTAAADDVRSGAPSLVRALLDRAEVPSEEANRLAADQVTDAVCELLRWSAGTFSFLVGDPDAEGLDLRLAAQDLVAEGERRKAVWPTLTAHIPSPETVLRLAASPAFDPSCSREEWGLIALVDGSRSVNEIVALLGRSEFAVAGALSALVERGLLTISTPGAGLGELQRRQDVIAALESGSAPQQPAAHLPVPEAQPEPVREPDPVVIEYEVPEAAFEMDVSEPFSELASFAADEPSVPALSSAPVFEVPQARSEDLQFENLEAMTDGSAALALADVPGVDGSTRGLDSAVTKSLVLRLIAGVRGL